MSHELRTPLNAMIGFAQLLGMDREPALAPHQRDWAPQIQRAGWHLLEMINDTLDLARIESGAVRAELAAARPGAAGGGLRWPWSSAAADKRGVRIERATSTADARGRAGRRHAAQAGPDQPAVATPSSTTATAARSRVERARWPTASVGRDRRCTTPAWA